MQQSPASQPIQRPPIPNQPVRPGYRPPPPGAPGYRPPMPRPGMQSPVGASPLPPHPGLPPNVRPGPIPPQPQQRPLVRPVSQSPVMAPAGRPAVVSSPVATPSTIQQQSPMSPPVQHAEHYKKKRMYPEQITKAYSGESPVPPAYPSQQLQQPYVSPAMANQQPQFISPMGAPSPYAQQQQQIQQPQPQQQQPQAYGQYQAPSVGYNTYGQDAVGQMATQFGNMSMGPAAVSFSFFFFGCMMNLNMNSLS